jgi:AraC-like DNA-binding protein
MSNLPDLSQYGTMPQRGNEKGQKSWNPKVLSPPMIRIMDLQLFNPTMTAKDIAQVVGKSPSHVKKIIGSDLYKTRYRERRAEVERLQHSKVAAEVAKFENLRDDMIRRHREFLDLDPTKFAGRELECERIRQKSVQDLLRLSQDNLPSAGGNGASKEVGEYEERTRTLEIDPTDPDAAYMKLQETWRRGTK